MEASKNYKLTDRAMYALGMLALVAITGFAPGARAQSGNVYSGNQTQIVGSAEEGMILQVNLKTVEPSQTTNVVGTAIGGAIGGLMLGSNQNQDWNTRAVAALLGTTLGGVVGNKVANATSSREAQELVIGLKNPQTGAINRVITVVQPEPFEALSANQQVIVINTGGAYRVIKRNYDPSVVQR